MFVTNKEPSTRPFVTEILPRIIGGAALLVYLLTLNGWISLLSLGTVLRTSGWSWQPQLDQPLTSALLLPIRLLPESWLPLALNLLTAFCAALVLVLLARTVVLLPQDLTPPDPFRKNRPPGILSTPTAWIPPVLAATACGLQLSFWEHATSASGEMFDLLLFAFVVRCLLEFRVSQSQPWLSRAALAFGAGMANNWAMLGFFPLFLAALIRTKGLGFFKGRFLLQMALCGLVGLSVYLWLPILHSLRPQDEVGFWMALKLNLKSQLRGLTVAQNFSFRIFALTSLLFLLLLSIRWQSHTTRSGDNRFGIFFTRITGHFVHGLFFAGSVWIALDPVCGPRRLGYGTPLLTYYYISALVVGYGAGYFLLIGSSPGKARRRWGRVANAAMLLLICALPPALAWRNLGSIRVTNGPDLREFAGQLCADLPPGRTVVLSDDPMLLFVARADLTSRHRDKDPLLVETRALPSPAYLDSMARRNPSRWPAMQSTNRLESASRKSVLALAAALTAREPLVYLHPSSGLFCENFTDQPTGLVWRMTTWPAGEITRPPLPAEAVAANEQLWQQRWTNHLQGLAARIGKKPRYGARPGHSIWSSLRLEKDQNVTALTLGVAYSKALNVWGVRLQQLGRWPEAGVWFARAIALNSANLPARINAEYNQRCQQGDHARLTFETVRRENFDLFDEHTLWHEELNASGPADEPTFLLRTGRLLLDAGHVRQAAANFARSSELAPDWTAPKLWLAESFLALHDFAGALDLTEHLQPANEQAGPALAHILSCRTRALGNLGRTNEAIQYLESFVERHGTHREVLVTAANLCEGSGQFEREAQLVERLLKAQPNNAGLLSRLGQVQLRLARFDDAIVSLTRALAISPDDRQARLHRAIAYLGDNQFEAARLEYEELLRGGDSPAALFGLGAIAWHQQNTNAAIGYYRQYLSNNIPNTPQRAIVVERLKQLRASRTP